MVERIRSFIAIDIDEPELLKRVLEIQRQVIATGARMKPVEPENLHITIRFLGEITRGMVEEVKRLLAGLRFKPFTIVIKGLGAFPNTRRPRVIWLGVSEGADQIERLYREIEQGLRRLGFPAEREQFVPHLTLARIKAPNAALVRLLDELKEVEVGAMTVRAVRLKKSTLTSRGPIYETLFEARAVE